MTRQSNSLLKLSTLAVALCVLLPGAVLAGPQATLPKDLPAYAPDKALPVPQVVKKTLPNGLEVWVVPRDGVPRVDAVLALRNAGLAVDREGMPGFASTLAGLLNEGSATRDSKAIAEAAQGLGGSVGASASVDGIFVSGNALASKAAPMLSLLAEVARTPTFPDREVALAKANALQSLKASEAQPSYKADRAMNRLIYGDHPYGRVEPTEASINAIDVAALRTAHAQRFRPDRALLVITGRIDPKLALREAERAFGDWKASGAALPEPAPARRQAPVRRVLIDRADSVQSTINLGRPALDVQDPDYIPLRLAGTVLGGGFSSRLNQNLREDKGYTYGAGGGLTARRLGGEVGVGADVRNAVTGAAMKEFHGELSRMANEPVPAEELQDTKRYVAGGYLISNQQQASVAFTLANNWTLGLPPEFLGEYVPKIRAVSAEQLQAVSRKYLSPDQYSVVIVGNAKEIREQLAPFGAFEDASE